MEATQLSLFPEPAQPQDEPRIKQAEWCFQFFDNEPVVFAWSEDEAESGDLVLSIEPKNNSSLSFNDKGMMFKIFAREMSEETKSHISNQLLKIAETDQNDSEN